MVSLRRARHDVRLGTVVGSFKAWGLPDSARLAVGAIEVIGALVLLIPSASFPASLVLMGLTMFRIAMAVRTASLPHSIWSPSPRWRSPHTGSDPGG